MWLKLSCSLAFEFNPKEKERNEYHIVNPNFQFYFSLKVLDHSVCPFFLEEGIKSEGQDFAGNACFLFS